MSVVMTIVQIVGLALTTVLLKQFTPLPFWACFLSAFPLFLLLFWGVLMLFSRGGKREGR